MGFLDWLGGSTKAPEVPFEEGEAEDDGATREGLGEEVDFGDGSITRNDRGFAVLVEGIELEEDAWALEMIAKTLVDMREIEGMTRVSHSFGEDFGLTMTKEADTNVITICLEGYQ